MSTTRTRSGSRRYRSTPTQPDPNRLIASADADQVVAQLRTFGNNTPKPPTVPTSAVTVTVADGTGTNVGASVVGGLAINGFRARAAADVPTKVAVSEIRYGYGQAEEAKALLPYVTDAKLVPDPTAKDAVQLVLGASFKAITVPPTTTTAPTVPGAPETTAPATTTTTEAPAPSDPCP